MGAERICTEDMIPVGVSQDDVARPRDALFTQKPQELFGVPRGGAGVQPDGLAIADDGAERGTVRRSRGKPVDVLCEAGWRRQASGPYGWSAMSKRVLGRDPLAGLVIGR